jgi:hypothetical protein
VNKKAKQIIGSFNQNFDSVIGLAEFDQLVLASAIQSIENIKILQDKHLGFEHPKYRLDACLDRLKKIRENDSLRIAYKTISNQCVVLLVSYFDSAVSDLFEMYLKYFMENTPNENLLKEDIKLTIEELKEIDFNLKDKFIETFSNKKSISFQDMQSISRAFKKYIDVDVDLVKDEITNTIILAQACRHAIVHDGSILNSKVIRQVSNANPRMIKEELAEGKGVEFDIDEIRTIGKCMEAYMARLCEKIDSNILTKVKI